MRRIWIIPKKEKIDDFDIANAESNNCPEIINGIPPSLAGVISDNQLPLAYEELEQMVVSPLDLKTEWDKATTNTAKIDVLAKALGLEE